MRSQQNSVLSRTVLAQQQHCLAGSAVEWALDINNLFLLRDSTAILKVLCAKRMMNLSPSACGVGYTLCYSTSFLSSRMQREHKSIRLLKRPLHYSTTESCIKTKAYEQGNRSPDPSRSSMTNSAGGQCQIWRYSELLQSTSPAYRTLAGRCINSSLTFSNTSLGGGVASNLRTLSLPS